MIQYYGSTMQKLAQANDRWRKNGKIDRIVCWSCILVVVGFSVYKIVRGMI